MPTNADLPDRQTTRMQDYDYSHPGYYCVTICTGNRRKLLGTIANGKMYPNSIGKTIQQVWETLPDRFPHVALDTFMLMPNHVYCIVVLIQPPPSANDPSFAHVPQRFQAHMLAQQAKKRYPPLGEVIRTFKAVSTYRIHTNGLSTFAWQKRYHEFVIRTEPDLARARHYIAMNPERWGKDPFNDGRED